MGTFDTYDQADTYAKQLEGLPAQGIVPVPLLDVKLLDTLRPTLLTLHTGYLTHDWAEGWVTQMKRD